MRDAVAAGQIRLIGDDVVKAFLSEVEEAGDPGYLPSNSPSCHLYPLSGTGNRPVRSIVSASMCRLFPNRSCRTAIFPPVRIRTPRSVRCLKRPLDMAKETQPDLLLATDPDCDRVRIAVRDKRSKYTLMSGNEVGCLLLNYLLSRRQAENTPARPADDKGQNHCYQILRPVLRKNTAAEWWRCSPASNTSGEQIGLLEKRLPRNGMFRL